MTKTKESTGKLSPNLFPVVGIGASAGGLDAFKKLLKAIPENSGMAFVLVQHLDPNHESMLPEILQKITRIPVLEITDDIKVQPDHIYVIPSNKMMVATDGVLLLTPRPPKNKAERNLPIDLFFTSLAEVHQTHAIGVVLSGTASDGTLGLKAIKDHGGITFAQDEASAAYESMPQSAVQAGVVDFVLPPEQIPEKLLAVTKIIIIPGDLEQNLPLEDEEVFKQIISVLRIRKGTDFTYYKQSTIRRRILRRMALNKSEEPAVYLKFLRENKPEQDILYQDLLIPVTSFFRDSKSFKNLEETVFPQILKTKMPGEPIRIWVAGCSTGEEAYSIAICFKELLSNNVRRHDSTGHMVEDSAERIQIFATDLSEPAISKARAGIYSKIEVSDVSPQRLQEFFTKSNGSYQVSRQVRDICVFATHNFLKDPPFGKIDLVSCRNVLIYMEPYLQKKALITFHYSLNPAGFLLLGKSETTGGVPDLFTVAAKNDKLYTRKDVPGRFMHVVSPRAEVGLSQVATNSKTENMRTDFQKTADDIMLSKYTPAGVVVNEGMDIVHFRGSTSNYLEQAPGKPSHNLMTMAKNGLAFELRNILHKARKEKAAVIKENIPVQVNDILRKISIEAIPLPNTIEPYYLILFHDKLELTNSNFVPVKKAHPRKSKTADKDERIHQLEMELAQTREDMRSITEDQEASNEELQSANEELLSGSEELQSLNEELETSKEELQISNEELTVVNQEMISLNQQITAARDYSEAIVSNIREPLLVLDKNLRVKTANNSFYKTFHVSEQETENVLIYDLGNEQWNIPDLRNLLEKILPEKTFFNDFEVTHSFPAIGSMVMLLNAREVLNKSNAEKLILLSIEDITARKNAHQKEEEIQHRYYNIIHNSITLISILKGPDLIIEIANDTILTSWGKNKDVIGKPLLKVFPELIEQGFKEILDGVYTTGKPYNAYEQPVYLVRHGKRELIYYSFIYQAQKSLTGEIEGITIIANEVTPQAVLNKKIKESEENFRQLAELMPQKIMKADETGHVIYYNQNWLTFSGMNLPELIETGWSKLFHPDDVEEAVKRWQQSIETGHDFEMELRCKSHTGEYKWHLSRTSAVKDENGKILMWIGSATEIHEQRAQREILETAVKERTADLIKANELLEERNDELGKMNKELESFAYISSHDLQEPLRKIQTFSNRILEKENEHLSDRGKDYFMRMQSAAARMQELIEDLLSFSRLSMAERKFQQTDLNTILDDVKKEFKETIEEKQATFEDTKLCPANIIPFQFRQLMHNLISNALKFSKRDVPPHIIIHSRIINGSDLQNEKRDLPAGKFSAEKNYCHVSVSDNGIGFDPQYKDQIFEVFQRLHGREEYSGTGIGLSIVKKITENHNGMVTATSEPGKGSTFDIYIPA